MTLTDYKPQAIVTLNIENNSKDILKRYTPFSITTFNIGYCGLDKNQDFFMDGGTMSRSESKKQTMINVEEISNFLAGNNPSFILLQEIDINSSRSYHINQLDDLQKKLHQYSFTFGLNNKVYWVPIPVLKPIGSVISCLATLSTYTSKSALRYQLPGEERWPVNIFDYDRCFIENRIQLDSGNELIMINTHLSAETQTRNIKEKQLQYLKAHILDEYGRGNYVITGGDWNYILPGSGPDRFRAVETPPSWLQKLPDYFTPPEFQWAVDKTVPTVRSTSSAYINNQSFTTVIDGFLVSPNVEILEVHGHQLDFENSDHNPVSATFLLK